MEGSKIVLIRGNSGSGKSTVARKLQHHLGRGTLLVAQDTVRREMLYSHDEPEGLAEKLLLNIIEYGFKNNKMTILEGILYSDYYKNLFDFIESVYGNNIYAYYFDISFDETLIRHKTKPIANQFGEKEMAKWWREKDFLKIIEEKIITEEMSADETAARILIDIGE